MRTLDYQRLVVGYHGCDASVRDHVIQKDGKLESSQNEYDWLGHGVYFWEHGPERALEWAKGQQKLGKIKQPAVVGALLHLGQCFDLLDAAYTDVLVEAFPEFCESLREAGKRIPKNKPRYLKDRDKILRFFDCAALNWTIDSLEKRNGTKFHSVRGAFQEGELVFPESGIYRRSHIQIAVRHPACVLGYFLPSSDG